MHVFDLEFLVFPCSGYELWEDKHCMDPLLEKTISFVYICLFLYISTFLYIILPFNNHGLCVLLLPLFYYILFLLDAKW